MLTVNDIFLESLLIPLEEVGISVTRRGKASKRAALAGGTAMLIAKKKNPGLYKKYVKFNLMRKQLKQQIKRQYGAMAAAAARRKMR